MKYGINSIVIAGLALMAVSCAQNSPKGKAEEKMPQLVNNVEVATAVIKEVPQDETYTTTVQAYVTNNVVPQSGSRIKKINVEIGDFVSKGQVLATINPTTLNETHRGALSTLKQAQDAYRRFQPLHKAGTISDIKWVEIESKLEQAKAAEAIARQQLTHTSIRAPFNGVCRVRQIFHLMNLLLMHDLKQLSRCE